MTNTHLDITSILDGLDVMQVNYDALSRDPATAERMRSQLLRASYQSHLERNAGYAAYAAARGVNSNGDMIRPDEIPLLPSGLFKQPDTQLDSHTAAGITRWCLSSGTSGSRSLVPRDDDTILRFLGSITSSIPALYGLDRAGGHRCLVLGPNASEAGDLWFSYAIGCLSLLMETETLESDGVFDAHEAARRLVAAIDDGEVLVIGPPARMLDVARAVADLNPGKWNFSPRSFAVTAGGWKTSAGSALDPVVFREELAEKLRIADPRQIRDSYNMVELNTVVHECAQHRKHVPPWVLAQARHPGTDRVLPDGELGVLAFWDPSATSYPSFVLSEDVGRVRNDACICGYHSTQVEVVRRLSTVESRGCALKMAGGIPSVHRDTYRDRFYQADRS